MKTLATLVMVTLGFGIWIPLTSHSQSKQMREDPKIRIVDASFGDQINHKTCKPDLSLCEGIASCKFTVGNMCTIDALVKNLEVTWDCGKGTEKHMKAAAQGTEIEIGCASR